MAGGGQLNSERTDHPSDGIVPDTKVVDTGQAAGDVDAVGSFAAGAEIGRYVLEERLGAGGMGVVFAARDPDLGRRVAVKLLRPKTDETPGTTDGRARLLREAQALARLSDPHVIEVFDVGVSHDHVFIAMELIDGQTLHTWLKTPRPWHEVLGKFIEAGRGLVAAHDAGLVHRDFKPSNVLVPADGTPVRVLDFGLAQSATRKSVDWADSESEALGPDAKATDEFSGSDRLSPPLTRRGVVMGTPMYMAPEQHLGRPVDARSDQFSFCVAVYAGLFGVRPHEGQGSADLQRSKLLEQIRAPGYDAGVPASIRRAIVRGLSSAPRNRWASMQLLLAELERASQRMGWGRFGLAAAGVGIVAAMALGQTSASVDTCARGSDPMAGAWDDDVRTRVRTALAETGTPYAEHSLAQVETRLDDWASQWLQLHARTCQEARGEEEPSARAADLRRLCLETRLDQLRAVTGVLQAADVGISRRAVVMVSALDSPAGCADAGALGMASPPDVATASAVAEHRRTLAQCKAHQDAGHYARASADAHAVVEAADALGYGPLRAEARYRQGAAAALAGDPEQAEAVLVEAVHQAEAVGHDQMAAMIATELVFVVGYKRARAHDGLQWGRHAQALVDRSQATHRVRATLLNNIGAVLNKAGHADEASQHHQDALALWEEIVGVDDIAITSTLQNLGNALISQGRYADAAVHHERTLELRRRFLGDDHPDVAGAMINLGITRHEAGRLDEAAELHAGAVEIYRRSLGKDHPLVATALHNLGNARFIQKRYDEALEHYRRAAELRQRVLDPDHPDLGSTYYNIAAVLTTTGEHRRAIEFGERASAIYEKAYPPDHPSLLSVRGQVATALMRSGRGDEAVAIHAEVLAATLKKLGAQHPQTASAKHNFGAMLVEIERGTEAIPLLEEALHFRESAPGRESLADTLWTLARAVRLDGHDRDRAESLAHRADQIYGDLGLDERQREIASWVATRR